MNETETRAEFIDPALKSAGWGVVDGSRILREYHITPGRIEGHGRRGNPLVADHVLAHVAFSIPPVTREVRASQARSFIGSNFTDRQQMFLDFVLQHYVSVGVEELDQEKLAPLLRLKYHDSIADAVVDLGSVPRIGAIFSGFQLYLYQEEAATA
jgi:hypothetical protein